MKPTFKPGYIFAIALAIFITCTLPLGAKEYAPEFAGRLYIIRGESMILSVRDVDRVAVADPEIADVVVVSRSEVLINGKKEGRTTLHIWDALGRTTFSLRVYEDTSELAADITNRIGIPTLRVWVVNGKAVIDGVVAEQEEKQRALAVAEPYVSEVIDLIRVVGNQDDLKTMKAVADAIGQSSITVRVINNHIVLEGFVESPDSKGRAVAIASTFSIPVIDLIQVAPFSSFEPLDEVIEQAIGVESISVSLYQDLILLEGAVSSEPAKQRAERIAQAFSSQVANFIEVSLPHATQEGFIARKIMELIADPRISVKEIEQSIVLEGTVETESDKKRALQLATLYSPSVLDLIEVRVSSQLQEGSEISLTYSAKEAWRQSIQDAINEPNVSVRVIGESVILEGSVESTFALERANKLAEAFTDKIISLIRIIPQGGSSAEEDLSQKVAAAIGLPTVGVRLVEGVLFLEGKVESPEQKNKVETIAQAFRMPVESFLTVYSQQLPGEAIDESSPKGLAAQVEEAIGLKDVRVLVIGETLILEGRVPTASEGHRALTIAKAFNPQVESLLVVNDTLDHSKTPDITEQIEKAIGIDGVSVYIIDQTLFLEGVVPSQYQQQRAEAIAKAFGYKVENLLLQSLSVQHGDQFKTLKEKITGVLGIESITVSMIDNTIILEGMVETQADYMKAELMAKAYGLPVINLISIKNTDEASSLSQQITATIDREGIQVYEVEGTIFLEGMVSDEAELKRAISIAEAFGSPVNSLLITFSDVYKESEAPLAQEVFEAIGIDSLNVFLIKDTLFLEGSVLSQDDRNRALAIARAYDIEVEDLIRVDSWLGKDDGQSNGLAQQITDVIGNSAVKVSVINGTVFLEGIVRDELAYLRAEQMAQAFGQPVVNLLQIGEALMAVGTELSLIDEATSLSEEERLDLLIQLIDDPNIKYNLLGEHLILTGSVKDQFELERINQLARVFFPGVTNALSVEAPINDGIAYKVSKAINRPSIQVSEVGDKLLLEGSVANQNELRRAKEIASCYGIDIIDMLVVEHPYMVLLQVHVVEISKTGALEIGLTPGSQYRGVFYPYQIFAGEVGIGGPIERLSSLMVQIQTLNQTGEATVLAAPTLVTMSGEESTFLAGGEIPIVITQDGKQSIEWKAYGVRLKIIPTVDMAGEITVRIEPEVSTIDWNNAITVEGLTIPALATKRMESSVRMASGSTLVIGGLIANEEAQTLSKIPILGDLPIIGKLFSSKKFQRNETELFFFVTPLLLPPDWQDGSSNETTNIGFTFFGE